MPIVQARVIELGQPSAWHFTLWIATFTRALPHTLLFALYRAPSLVFPGLPTHIERFARPDDPNRLMLGDYPQYIVEETPRPAVMNQMVREQTKWLAMVCRAGWKGLRVSRQFADQDVRIP